MTGSSIWKQSLKTTTPTVLQEETTLYRLIRDLVRTPPICGRQPLKRCCGRYATNNLISTSTGVWFLHNLYIYYGQYLSLQWLGKKVQCLSDLFTLVHKALCTSLEVSVEKFNMFTAFPLSLNNFCYVYVWVTRPWNLVRYEYVSVIRDVGVR